MIDIHNHLLYGVDDGCSSLLETRKLLVNAINEGISDVCITPHFSRFDDYIVTADRLQRCFLDLKEETKDLKINLYLGNELMIEKKLDERLVNKEVLSLNNSRYVLVEFPFEHYREEYNEYLYNITVSGYKVIIAHPERYYYVMHDPDKYINHWINEGYYIQCNQTSLKVDKQRRIIFNLIEKQNIHFIASDGHNVNRPVTLKEAYSLITKKFSKEVSNILLETNPLNVINDSDVFDIPKTRRHLW